MIIPDVFSFTDVVGQTYLIPMKSVEAIDQSGNGQLTISIGRLSGIVIGADKADDFLRAYQTYMINTSPRHAIMRGSNSFIDRVIETLEDVKAALEAKGHAYRAKIERAQKEIEDLESAYPGTIVTRKGKV